MKKEYLQPFLKAAEKITERFFGFEVENSNISLDKELYMDKDIIIALAVKGQLTGIVFFGINEEEAIELSSKVIENEEKEWNELAQSVLLEFGNQVVGYVTELYGEKGITCDISIPKFVRKEQLTNYGKECVQFEMINDVANFMVKLYINESQKSKKHV